MNHTLKRPSVIRSEPKPLADAFFQRLLDFYHRQPQPNISPIWEGVLNLYHSPLIRALESGQVGALRGLLDNLYVDNVMCGLDAARNEGECLLRFEWSAIALGNMLGSIPLYAPQQPHVLDLDARDIILGAESLLGFKLTYPGGGRMWGVGVEDRFIPFKLLDICTCLLHLPDLDWVTQPILEIGSGCGMLGYVAALMSDWQLAGYDSIDLPSTSVIGAYLSAGVFSPELVHLQGEVDLVDPVRFMGTMIPEDCYYGLVFNQDSLPEMPESVARTYVDFIGRMLRPGGYFLSVNHESPLGGQKRVFDLVKEHTKLKQISRSLFFSRPGYLAEVWRKP